MGASFRVVGADGIGETVVSPEFARDPVTVPGIPGWRPYSLAPDVDRLCVGLPGSERETCVDGTSGSSWTPAAVAWVPRGD